jgi:glucose/arabinose dehydrogenase
MGPVGKAVTFVFLLAASRVGAAPSIDLQLVANNLDKVTAITHAGDGSGRLFITLQGGRVMIYNGTNVLATPFLDIRPMVLTNATERGLLSTAFSPGFATNGFVYVYFTAIDTSNMVARFTALPLGTNSVSTNTMQTVIRLPHPGQDNHNGGQVQFGPDDYLYIGPGDGGGGCDPPDNAQNLSSPLGKMLRIDMSGFTANYTIPPNNPFVTTTGAHPEIWAYGLRNPWRFSFDRLTGDLFIGDVGQDTREEVDFQPAGSPGGQNYGWKCIEGTSTNTCAIN